MKKLYIALFTVLVLLFVATASVSAAEYVYYENDFSDPATLSDFTQYRGEWSIVDGQLMLTGLGELGMDEQAFFLFTKDPAVMNLTDYILEVDLMNIQTQAGPLFRCDITKADGSTNNSFYGYQAFLSFTGTKGALGRGNLVGDWAGNLKVSPDVTAPGANLHLKVTAEGKTIHYVMTDIESEEIVWDVTIENEEWALGSFGLRGVVMNNGLTNLGMLGVDNFKVTAIGEVGDHLAAGKALADYKPNVASAAIMPKVTRPLEIVKPKVVEVAASSLDDTKTEYVFYENDFSNPATLSDFTQYRGDWVIKDGMLYYSALTEGFDAAGNFSFILYSANHDANLLRNYTVEMDVYNSQSACGLISHADLSQASSDNANAFYGYTGFISNDGTKGATGYSNVSGAYGGNLSVSGQILTPGSNYHLKAEHMDGVFTFTVTAVGSDEVLWSYVGSDADWTKGSFGIRSVSSKDLLINLNAVGFDNLKVTVYGEEAVLLNAGYHPNAKVVGELAIATEAPAETTAAPAETADAVVTGEAVVTEDAVTETSADVAETTAAPAETEETAETTAATQGANAPAEEKGVNVVLIVGIAVAVLAVIAVVVVVLKKKK